MHLGTRLSTHVNPHKPLFHPSVCIQHRVFATLEQYDAYEAALAHACALDDVLQDEGCDSAAIQQALHPAWAALDAALHKEVCVAAWLHMYLTMCVHTQNPNSLPVCTLAI